MRSIWYFLKTFNFLSNVDETGQWDQQLLQARRTDTHRPSRTYICMYSGKWYTLHFLRRTVQKRDVKNEPVMYEVSEAAIAAVSTDVVR